MAERAQFRVHIGGPNATFRAIEQSLAIPFERNAARVVEYLKYLESQAALLIIDRTTRDGRRDQRCWPRCLIPATRVQDFLDLRPSDVQRVSPAHGKGRKERLCPFWPQTAQLH